MIGFVCISARILGHHTESSRLEVCDISLMCNIVSNYYNCLYYNCYHLDHYDHYDHNFYYFSGFFSENVYFHNSIAHGFIDFFYG